MFRRIKNFLVETEAATAVEYAVLLVLIAGAIIASIQAVGGAAAAYWDYSRDSIKEALDQ